MTSAEARNDAPPEPAKAAGTRRHAEPRLPAATQAALKRKEAVPGRSDVSKLKEKARASTGRKKEASDDVELLKAKLAELQSKTSSRALSRPAERAVSPLFPGCRIEWAQADGKATFHATLRTGDGRESMLLESPSFRWSKSMPPPKDLPQVAQAYATLVARLKARGWVTTGRGADWYSLELQRRPRHTGRSAREGET